MSNPNGSPEPVAWQVTSQVATTGRAESGNFVPGINVSFRFGTGSAGTVFIPNELYSPDNVAAAVSARVRAMADVANLSGQA